MLALVAGLAIHEGALAYVSRHVVIYPTVSDVVMDHWPVVTFGIYGEIFFFSAIAAFCLAFFPRQRQQTPQVIVTLGLLYALRGLFLLFLPIGAPLGALAPSERINLWGFANHAFFPGGHAAILFMLAMMLNDRRWRRIGFVVATMFVLGTMLSKTHYTADALGGWLLAYAVVSWSRKHLARWRMDSSSETIPRAGT